MKKLGFLGVVILGCAGCGHGWLPFRPFKGAMCRDNCVEHAHCDGCGAAGYPSYATEGVVSDSYIGGAPLPPPSSQPMSAIQPGR